MAKKENMDVEDIQERKVSMGKEGVMALKDFKVLSVCKDYHKVELKDCVGFRESMAPRVKMVSLVLRVKTVLMGFKVMMDKVGRKVCLGFKVMMDKMDKVGRKAWMVLMGSKVMMDRMDLKAKTGKVARLVIRDPKAKTDRVA